MDPKTEIGSLELLSQVLKKPGLVIPLGTFFTCLYYIGDYRGSHGRYERFIKKAERG